MIKKIGAAIINENKLLVVSKKKYPDMFMLPGGKPEGDEEELETLSRELYEELKLGILKTDLLGTFNTVSMLSDEEISITVYLTKVKGEPVPSTEIYTFKWIDINSSESQYLGTGITEFTLPFIRSKMVTLHD